ncbi:transketolase [Primorskyibacter aestuariivivens]|uniref:transketolase n=1 Tax=Primorskyibacter aestuariivivens TaxID=1888912 RepID=UPI0023008031|nr:transketolase [Primorskyibacter aestuariivivens]MDA7429528.1 transketolase [Primorskyibacter aestuariivivens]
MPNIQTMADAIRFLSIDAILNAGEGHQGVPLGMAEIAATLYANHLKVDPSDPLWPDRDRVVLSNGHGSMLLYALLHLSGYEKLSIDAIKSFRTLHSVCAGHPEIEQDAGIEITTGLLGQGIACAVGMAVAEERLAARFGRDLVDHRTWAFVGDGCLQEGMGQEAISLAGHLQLGRLTFLWDDNQITDDGETALSISEDVSARFRAAGWHVATVDGHDIKAIDAAISAAKADPRPSLIACRTTIARGIARLQGQRGGHSAPLTKQDAEDARRDLSWPHPAFHIPAGIYADWTNAMKQGTKAREAWGERLSVHPDAPEFRRWINRDLPEGWASVLPDAPHQPRATILSSGDICDALADTLPEMVVLCADLEAPTNHKRSRDAFAPGNRAGSYVHCGVREHLMGAMVDGIAAHGGLRPVNVTYLAFADYERAAIRMAAVMGLPALFVFSHDSIGVGSNGPTHQPVEILASFRAMPDIHVFRPADAVEVAEAWQIALETNDTPMVLALSRQDTEQVRFDTAENRSRLGGYVLAGPESKRDITLIATGTEVGLAMRARTQLEGLGIATTVVSMPCWELFEHQPETYQSTVLGQEPRIAIEAALKFGWDRWLRPTDQFIGMTGFGASAKAPALYEHFGITVEKIVEVAKQLAPVR